jgi:molecular chaperone GrpE
MSEQQHRDDAGAGAPASDAAHQEEPEVVDAEVVEENPDDPTGATADAEEAADEVEVDFDALLDETRRERDEYLDLAQRARADFENFRRRAQEQSKDAERRGKAGVAKALLPALDNLERALAAAGFEADARADAESADPPSQEVPARDALAEGVALVLRELHAGLERAGVSGFDPAGESFDPVNHEAISTASADGVEPGTVIETLERGYRIDDWVIRPARVVVSG